MKNLMRILGMIVIGSVLFSCEETESVIPSEDTAAVVTADAELPTEAQSFIETNFVSEVVADAYTVTSDDEVTYEAILSNDVTLVFDKDGQLKEFGEGRYRKRKNSKSYKNDDKETTEIETTDLPEATQTYLTENYADVEVLKSISIVEDEETSYKVLLSNVGSLEFDQDGAFVELNGTKATYGDFVEVDSADLNENILSYITTNYPEASVSKASTGTIDDLSRTLVGLTDIGLLIFDENNEFLELKEKKSRKGSRKGTYEEIEIANLDAAITDYINTNYPDSVVEKAALKTLDEVSTTLVSVENVGVLVFDADNAFVELKVKRVKVDYSDFEEVAVEDLNATITEHINTNYADAEIGKAITGTVDEAVQTLVYLEEVGVLVFDADNAFVELKEFQKKKRRRRR